MVHASFSEHAGKECFVRYGRYDSLNMLMAYNYGDAFSPLAFSVPTTIDLGAVGEIVINRLPGSPDKAKMPKQLRNIAHFAPRFGLNKEERRVTLSTAIIPPPEAPRALRRILTVAVQALSERPNLDTTMELVDRAERQIIDSNKQYYEQVLKGVEEASSVPDQVSENIKTMAHHQLGLLNAYSFVRARG